MARAPVRRQVDTGGKIRRVVRGANENRSSIGGQIKNAIRDGHAFGLRAKIMILDRRGFQTPHAAIVLFYTLLDEYNRRLYAGLESLK